MPLQGAPAIRNCISLRLPQLRTIQRRWAQVHDVRFLATHKTKDRIIERYREQLDKKAKQQGLSNIEELKEAYKDKIQNVKRRSLFSLNTQIPPEVPASPFPPPPPPPEPLDCPQDVDSQQVKLPSLPPGVKTLASFIDVPKTLDLPQKEIEYIWRLWHAREKNSLCAAIPYKTYERIQQTAKKHPQFILPLPREGQGAEIHFLQWTFPSPTTATVLFTHLAEYKLRGEFSQPHTTVTHHLDLAGPKQLVLVQGTVVEGRGVTVDEGKWLLMCLQKFYGQGAEETPKKRLMEQFSQGDGDFKVDELLEEAEKIA